VSSLRGIPTSRAYWELRAEQMMNRIFDPEPLIDLEADETATRPRALLPPGLPVATASLPADPLHSASPTRTASPDGAGRRDQPLLLLSILGGVCMVSAASSVLYLSHWNQMQQSLSQERNLLLVERLRSLGPANPVPATPRDPAPTPLPLAREPRLAQEKDGDGLPPPPEEPWMEQLGELPHPEATAPSVLRVPLSPKLGAAAPPATAPSGVATAGPVPELLGVVAAPGKAGSAIFQTGGNSSNVGVGESIGSSGWRLRSAEGDAVLIERGGEVRRVSLGSGS
jgi:hypothetical protein